MDVVKNEAEAALLTKQETAEYLKVSDGTIDKWVREGQIPYYLTPGRHLRFKRGEVEQFALRRGPKFRESAGNA